MFIGDRVGTRWTTRRSNPFNERELNPFNRMAVWTQDLATHQLNICRLDKRHSRELWFRFEQSREDPAGGIERRDHKDPFASWRDTHYSQLNIRGKCRFCGE